MSLCVWVLWVCRAVYVCVCGVACCVADISTHAVSNSVMQYLVSSSNMERSLKVGLEINTGHQPKRIDIFGKDWQVLERLTFLSGTQVLERVDISKWNLGFGKGWHFWVAPRFWKGLAFLIGTYILERVGISVWQLAYGLEGLLPYLIYMAGVFFISVFGQ